MSDPHLSADTALEPDEGGWYTAACTCGFTFGPLPALTEVVDVLMDHAGDEARSGGSTT